MTNARIATEQSPKEKLCQWISNDIAELITKNRQIESLQRDIDTLGIEKRIVQNDPNYHPLFDTPLRRIADDLKWKMNAKRLKLHTAYYAYGDLQKTLDVKLKIASIY